MKILAHRANLSGPHSCLENSLKAVETAFQHGFGIETDLRRSLDGRLYISHDAVPFSQEIEFSQYEELFRSAGRTVAMNVKELGYEETLIQIYREGALGPDAFYFDFELLEPSSPGRAQARLRSLKNGAEVRMAARLSDRGEDLKQCLAIPGEVVWADEFDSLWLTPREIDAVRNAGRQIWLISPELHGFDREARLHRWAEFKQWGIDGLCTDFALEAAEFFA